MLRSPYPRAALAAFVAAVLLAAAAPAEAESVRVKIGIVKGLLRDLKPALFRVLAVHFQTVMESQTGLRGELVSVESAEALRQQLADGAVQLGVFHGFEFGWMRDKQPDLEPLMLNAIDPDSLKAVVVVAKNSPAKGVGCCRGQRLALAHNTRADIKLYLTRQCGGSLRDYFGEPRSCVSPEDALDDLADGNADVAVVDRACWKMFARRKPGRAAKLRMLEESDKFPPSVIAFRKGRIDREVLERFRDGMSTAHRSRMGTHLMTLMKVERFEPVTPDYHHSLAETVRAYPPPE
jgi:ABC-type phosphate/phosphonate transport system substrate-binding protein